MNTIKLIPIVVFLLCFQQAIQAQALKNNIEKSVVEIGHSFPEISMDRLKQIDQVAFLVFKKLEDSPKVDVLFIDDSNQEISQLAMIWFETGMIYYGHSERFNIQSAGVTPKIEPMSKLEILKEYGFSIKDARGKNPMSSKIDYGSGNWIVYPKSTQSLESNNENTFKIYLENVSTNDTIKSKIELLFTDINSIPREMLYMATRINNLLKTKQ